MWVCHNYGLRWTAPTLEALVARVDRWAEMHGLRAQSVVADWEAPLRAGR